MTTFSTEPLVDLDDVKAHLSIDTADTSQDGELIGFIEAATDYIQNLTGPINAATFTETHSGGRNVIFVDHPPILSVTSVVEYVGATGYSLTQVALGDSIGAYAFSVDNPRSGALRRRYSGGVAGNFVGGDHNVVVTYIAGLAAVPADIRMAVLQDIAGLFQPSQLGPGSGMFPNSVSDGNGPLTPIGMFPRVAEILTAASTRLPGIG